MSTPDGIGGDSNMVGPHSDIVVAVATYRRVDGISAILPELVAQARALARPASVIVVDNNPDGSAYECVSSWLSDEVVYVHEPTPGIAAARNRALEISRRAQAIVFVDDDEMPSPGWLENLVGAWERWGCEGVSGPAIATFAEQPSEWILAAGVFDRPDFRTGDVVAGAATNNLLLSVRALERLGLRFDESYGITGGSDTKLVHSLIRAGGVVRWCDEAEVVDHIPPSRCTRKWALARTLRTSSVWSRVALELAESRLARLRTVMTLGSHACYRIIRGTMALGTSSVAGGTPRRARGLCDISSGVGIAMGCLGLSYKEYRRKRLPSANETSSDTRVVAGELR